MNADKLATWLFRVVLIYCVVLALDSSRACAAEEATATDAATTPTDKPAAPMSEPAAWRNKLTLSYYYFSSGNKGVDLNLRHSFESSTGWIGAYRETDGFDQLRTGWEYDLRREWFTIIPSVQAATHGFLGASIYSEVGQRSTRSWAWVEPTCSRRIWVSTPTTTRSTVWDTATPLAIPRRYLPFATTGWGLGRPTRTSFCDATCRTTGA